MYKKLVRANSFVKDISKVKFSDKYFEKFVIYTGKLLSSEELPKEALDHSLKGNWTGYREFHISGDLLVIYKVQDSEIILVRIGSHSQLFE